MTNKKTKSKISFKAFGELLKYIWKNSPFIFSIIVVALILATAIQAASNSYLGVVLVNRFLKPWAESLKSGNPVFDWKGFTISVVILASFYAIAAISTTLANRLIVSLTYNTIHKLRKELYNHVQKLPLEYFDSNLKGKINSLFGNDILALQGIMSGAISGFVNSVTSLIVSLVLMFYFSWFLTLIALFTIFILFLISALIANSSKKFFERRQKLLGELNGYSNEFINGIKVIKVFNYEDVAFKKYKAKSDEFYKYDLKSKIWVVVLYPLMINIGSISYGILAIIGALILVNGGKVGVLETGLNIGVLISFLQFSKTFASPVANLSQLSNAIFRGVAGAQRVFEVLGKPLEKDNGTIELIEYNDLSKDLKTYVDSNLKKANYYFVNKKQNTVIKPALGTIEFKNVNFGYKPDHLILKNINLKVPCGKKVAFVGATGAGKTTITNLINRFYDVTSGEILIDGININDLTKNSLRKSLGFVLQDTSLFSQSVFENIKYAKPNATEEEILQAANLANAENFILMMENQYHTVLENSGENLSQGQKQLLSIARTSMLNPLVLVLDEATSTIDTKTEKDVQQALYKLMKNKTSFVIAHRLSTIQNVDKIVVMDKGQIIEQGTHQDLLANQSHYWKLFNGLIELD